MDKTKYYDFGKKRNETDANNPQINLSLTEGENTEEEC